MIDATEPALRLTGDVTSFSEVSDSLSRRFSGLVAARLGDKDALKVPSDLAEDDGYLELSKSGDVFSVVLKEPVTTLSDRHQWLMSKSNTQVLNQMLERAPVAMWATHNEGKLLFGNAEFRTLAEQTGKQLVFDTDTDAGIKAKETRRVCLETNQSSTSTWFDVTMRPAGSGMTLNYAVNTDAIVTAEAAQRNFVQTLTKTFAQLSIGLAIFDRKRHLALFNPALIDLTELPAEFLSSRPTLSDFFDQLRDRQIMPEPRNYKNWRDQLSDMLAAAQDGEYCETWTLPSGLTYRINGKPHPDGAVAFLFEDISAEISLTRRFRAELELSQSVLDAMDSAIAVFSRTGTLTFANTHFRDLWKCAPDESFIEMTVLDLSRIWQEACEPSQVWGEVRDFVGSMEDRAEWLDVVHHKTRGELRLEMVPLGGRATMVRFSDTNPANAIKQEAEPTIP